MAYKIGDRMQATFLPPVINDYIGDKDPVRVYDSFDEVVIDLCETNRNIPSSKAAGATPDVIPIANAKVNKKVLNIKEEPLYIMPVGRRGK